MNLIPTLRKQRPQGGFTIVEIMIAVALSLVLLAAVMQLFGSTKRLYSTNEATARLQESIRFINDAFAYDIRHSGHLGCADPAVVVPELTASADASIVERMSGYESGSGLTGVTPVAGTDAITLRYATPAYAVITEAMSGADGTIKISKDDGLGATAGAMALVSACKGADNAEIFTITDVSEDGAYLKLAHAQDYEGGQVNRSGNLFRIAQKDDRVMLYRQHTYFVRDTGRKAVDGSPVLALARSDGAGQVADLVDGVENMQILYGVRMPDGGIRYGTAATVADFNDVVSVQIGVLIASTDRHLDEPTTETFVLAGTSVDPAPDRKLRRAVNITAQLRNQRIDS